MQVTLVLGGDVCVVAVCRGGGLFCTVEMFILGVVDPVFGLSSGFGDGVLQLVVCLSLGGDVGVLSVAVCLLGFDGRCFLGFLVLAWYLLAMVIAASQMRGS